MTKGQEGKLPFPFYNLLFFLASIGYGFNPQNMLNVCGKSFPFT
jgi:hypothetical protein